VRPVRARRDDRLLPTVRCREAEIPQIRRTIDKRRTAETSLRPPRTGGGSGDNQRECASLPKAGFDVHVTVVQFRDLLDDV